MNRRIYAALGVLIVLVAFVLGGVVNRLRAEEATPKAQFVNVYTSKHYGVESVFDPANPFLADLVGRADYATARVEGNAPVVWARSRCPAPGYAAASMWTCCLVLKMLP